MEPASSLSSPGIFFLHFDSAQGPPSGGRTARYVVHISHGCGGIPTLRRRSGRGGRFFLGCFGSSPSASHAHCEATAAGSVWGCQRPRDLKFLVRVGAALLLPHSQG